MKMQMEGGGEVKAFSVTKCTPEAVVRNAQPQHIKDTAPPSARPLGMHRNPSIYLFFFFFFYPDKHLTPYAALGQ